MSLLPKIMSILALFCLFEGIALADVLPGPAMPEQVGRALQSEEQQPSQSGPPAVSSQEKPQTPVGEEAEKIKFKLNGIILEGNHVYTTQQLMPLYNNQLNKTITVADLFGIVQNITNYYRNNGYIISRAILPPQHVKNGVVKIQIIEGYLSQVDVSGHPRGTKCLIKVYGKKIQEKRPLQINRMEKYLYLANEIPATQVKAVLSPSKTDVGAADLTLVTENKPITGYVSYDDYGTRYIGPQQMTANLAFSSLVGSGDLTQITVTKTPKGSELTFVDINESTQITDEGARWLLGGTRVQTHPLFVLQPVDIVGRNNNYYTTINFPVMRSRGENFTFRTGFNYLDSYVTTLGSPLYTDHLRNLDLGLTYNFADHLYGANLINIDFRQGLPMLGYSQSHNPYTAQTSRPGGRANYTKFTLQASRLQAFKGPVSLFGTASGQYAFNPLLASEQFSFGGSQIGRGYDVAELIGDRGLSGSLELRWDINMNIERLFMRMMQPYIFYDIGVIWNILALGDTPVKQSASSTGFGVRLFATKYLSATLTWAQPLTKTVATEALIGDGWHPRMFFSVVAEFG